MSRILIIDDNEAITRFLERVLVDAGHVVQVAAGGQAASPLTVSSQPMSSLPNIVMPDMEGWKSFENCAARTLA